MSENKNILDKLFRDRLYNREFEFDEQAWKDVEKQLDQNNRKLGGKWKNGLYGLIALLFISGAGYVSMAVWQNQAPASTDITSANQLAKSIENNTGQSLNETKVLHQAGNDDKILSGKGSTSISGINEDTEDNDALVNNNESVNISDKQATNSVNTTTGTNEFLPEPLAKTNIPATTSTKTNNKPNTSNKQSYSSAREPTHTNALTPSGINTPIRLRNLDNQDIAINSAEGTYASINELVLEKMESLQPSWEVEHEKDILKGKLDMKAKENRQRRSLLAGWGIIVGGGYGIERNIPGDGESNNVSVYFGGLRYARYLKANLSVYGNLVYKQVNNINLGVNINAEQYDFGFNNTTTVVTTNKLAYLELPIYLNYYLAGRFNVYAGIQGSKLLNAWSDRTDENQNDFGSNSSEAKKQSGYLDHLEEYHFSLPVGAEYLLNERVSIGLRYNHGLTGINKKVYNLNSRYNLNDVKFTVNINLGK